VVVDLRHGIAPDTLGAAVGAIRRGGLLLLWTMPTSDTRAEGDSPGRFEARFDRVFTTAPGVAVASQSGQWVEVSAPISGAVAPPGPRASPDQTRAVAAILKAARGRAGRPAVLTSDRGRG